MHYVLGTEMSSGNGRKAAKRVALSLVIALILCGCVGQTAMYSGTQGRPGAVAGLHMVDARPEEEKTTQSLSFLAWSCDNGVRRLGDDITYPSRITLLRQDLQTLLDRPLANATVTVTGYRIFYNPSPLLRETDPRRGKLGEGVLTPRECRKEKTTGGWYAADEVATGHSPLIVEIEARLGGKKYAARSVFSPQEELLDASWGESVNASVLFNAMHQAHVALADQIRRSPPPADAFLSASDMPEPAHKPPVLPPLTHAPFMDGLGK
jgi:hypothetical protein